MCIRDSITIVKEVEIIKEVPVEVVREVEVVKSIDFDSLKKMMAKMGTVEVSKKVVGETRTAQKAKIVDRRDLGTTSTTRGKATITRGKTTLLTGKAAAEAKKKSKASSKASTTTSSKKSTSKKVASKKISSKAKARSGSSKKDDLKKIEGIGPKIEQLLNKDGCLLYTSPSPRDRG